jgi:hypothetical protein
MRVCHHKEEQVASINLTRYAMSALLVVVAALPLYGQAPPAPPAGAPPGSQPEPKLAFDREVFAYPAEGRRDPFKPLGGGPGSSGPLFQDLALRGIIFSPDARRSVALVQVGGRRTFRLRRGDIIGNARVLEIQPLRVRFAVENFGRVSNETLELRGNNQIRLEQPVREVPSNQPAAQDSGAQRRPNNPRLNPDTIKQRQEGRP